MLLVQHPILATEISPGRWPRLRLREQAEVPLRIIAEPPNAWLSEAEREIARGWPRDRPRLRAVLIQHAPADQTLLLTLHHPISDGHSSLVVLRDILGFIAEPQLAPRPHVAGPLEAYLPLRAVGAAGLRASTRFWLREMLKELRDAPPERIVGRETARREDRVHIVPQSSPRT
jgi:hypothetical protein